MLRTSCWASLQQHTPGKPNRKLAEYNCEVGLFIGDTFRITPKLTIGYGLRWDYYASPTYDNGLMYNWNPANGDLVVAQRAISQVSPLYPSNITVVPGAVARLRTNTTSGTRLRSVQAKREDSAARRLRRVHGILGPFDRLLSGGPFGIAQTYYQDNHRGNAVAFIPDPFRPACRSQTCRAKALQLFQCRPSTAQSNV